MLLEAQESQLVLVDYQQKLMPAIHDAEAMLANAVRLARAAQLLQVPVVATEQNPAGLGPTVAPLQTLVGKPVAKMAFSGAAAVLPRLRPQPRAAGNARSLPKHLQKPAARRSCSGPASCWLAAKPTSACCRQRSNCWTRSWRSGW